ncbi:MAG: hypothetical protein WCF10_09405 [Polyangiales bacterium]
MGKIAIAALWTLLAMMMQAGVMSPAKAEEPLALRLALPPSYFVDASIEGEPVSPPLPPTEPNAPSTPRECKPRYMAGPAVGIPLSVGSMILGGVMVGAGTDYQVLASGSGSNVPGLIGGGSVLLAVGAAAMVYSAIKLTKNVHRRALVCDSANAERKLR